MSFSSRPYPNNPLLPIDTISRMYVWISGVCSEPPEYVVNILLQHNTIATRLYLPKIPAQMPTIVTKLHLKLYTQLSFLPLLLCLKITLVHLHIDFLVLQCSGSDEMALLWSHRKGMMPQSQHGEHPLSTRNSRQCPLRAQAIPESYWSSLTLPAPGHVINSHISCYQLS